MTAPPANQLTDQRTGQLAVTLFSGGRGSATIARQLLRTPGISLSIVVNGYDNGMSTGTLRRYLPGMLGPSDFRKNLLLHLDPADPAQAAMIAMLNHRLPATATRADLAALVEQLAAQLPGPVRVAAARELAAFQRWCESHPPPGPDLADCALGNLVFAGAYLRLGGDFNAAVQACAGTFGSPVQLLNVTGGENAFLVAVKADGQLLADEADIVAPQDGTPITALLLLAQPLRAPERAALAGLGPGQLRAALARRRARVSLNPAARAAVEAADLIIYGPGTPHSSLLPSYLTPGLAAAVAASRARARVLVTNLRDDHDVAGLGPAGVARLTLGYLGDPGNRRRTLTHVLADRSTPAGPPVPGVRWLAADLADPADPAVHCGPRTVAALLAVAGPAPATGPSRLRRAGRGRLVAGRHVWFCDLDGTLVDSGPVHAAAFRDAIAQLAPDLLGSFRYDDRAGATTRDVVAGLGTDPDLAQRLVRRKQQLYRAYVEAGQVAAFPGAHRLLDQLACQGRTAYLVTSGSRGSVERVLSACALTGRFRGVLTGDDVPSGKPDPVVYREACRRWAVDPAQAVAVEDSVHGVASALGAGLVTLQVHARRALPGAVAVRHLDEIASLLEGTGPGAGGHGRSGGGPAG